MSHGQRSEMKDLRLSDEFRIHITLREHHIRSRIPVERELPVAVRKCVDERQRCIHFRIHHQAGRVNSHLCNRIFKKRPKLVLSDFPEERCLLAHFIQKRKHVARRAARACLKHIVALFALPVHCKIDQKLAKGDHIKILLHIQSSCWFDCLVKVYQFLYRVRKFNILCFENRSLAPVH